jgi:CRP/FNR family transcriptional regulator, cyclic AMP receptor protein
VRTQSTSPEQLAGSSSEPDLADLSEMLSRVLPTARPETHRLLAETARTGTAKANEIIFWQGEPIRLTLVVDGHVAFRRTTPEGRELVLGLATRGDLFGYTSISTQRASVDLVALMPAEVALWPAGALRPLVAGDPGLALDVIDGMARYIVDIAERMDGFIHQNARGRVARILTRYGDLFFGQPATLSRAHLPSLVGTSREMTGRVLRDLEREGLLIRVGQTGLRLLSPERLHETAALNEKESA